MRQQAVLVVFATVLALPLAAQSSDGEARGFGDGFGARACIGTDITFGGVAFGVGVNHLILDDVEVGLSFYYGSFEETTEESVHTYEETTEITAFLALLNYLYGYEHGEASAFFVGGVGLGYIGVYWEESSDTDSSLGTPLSGGGSKQDFEGAVGGLLFNLGGGYAFAGGLDLRLEIPIMITFGDTGGASGVLPLFSLTAGYRFSF